MFDGTDLSNHIHSDDFAVDNTDSKDPSLNSLREAIIRTGDELSETVEIPLKWIQLEKSLLERKHLKLISVKIVVAIDSENEFPLGDMEQIKLFLRYHHAKGTLVYFDEEPISEYVVLDPQYLIDAFKCIITSERFCTNEPEIRPLWKMLLTDGRLEKQLIDRQWGKPDNKLDMFMQNKEILLSFLVKHHIISEAKIFDEDAKHSTGLGWFWVPSLLRDHSSRTEKTEFLNGRKLTKLRYVLFFKSSPIVSTVYHRLVSAAIGKWPVAKAGKKTLLFKDMCIVRLNVDHAGIIEIRHDSIDVTVVGLCHATDVKSEQADRFRRFLESVTTHEFQKLRSTEETNDKPYTIMFRCNNDSHGASGSENLISIDDMRRGNVVPCPDLIPHDIDIVTAKEEWFQENQNITVIPNNQLTNKLLSRLSQCIGENWQLLGLELGLTQVQIDHIVEDHPRSAFMRIYAMLQKRFQENVDKATLKTLVETLQRCTLVHVDWDRLRNVVDELMRITKYIHVKFPVKTENEEMAKSNDYTILLCGDPSVGKFEMACSFTKGKLFNITSSDFMVKTIEVAGKKVNVEIWDTTGLEYSVMFGQYCRCAMGMMLVYDITDKKTFKHILDWLAKVKRHRIDLEDLQIILIGNNCDLEHMRKVPMEKGVKLASSLGIKFMEVSVKESINVGKAFLTLTEDMLAHTEKLANMENPLNKKTFLRRIFQPNLGGKAQTATTVPEEIQQDPYALDLYERALRDGIEKDRSIRINIVGNYRQGKTSLMRRLLGRKVSDVSSTDGIDVIHYKCHRTVDGKFSLNKVTENDESDVVERLVSAALTSKHDQHYAQKVMEHECDQVQQMLESNRQEIKGLPSYRLSSDFEDTAGIENKSKKRVLSEKETEMFTKKLSQRKSQTIAKETETLFDIWDFGGQHVFYATHTLFHSKNAIYLLVFDLSLDLKNVIVNEDFQEESEDKDMAYFLRFWMNSIHSFVGTEDGSIPKVILVGTHKDKVKGNAKVKHQHIKQYFNQIRALFDGTKLLNHIHTEDFAVDNTIANDEEVVALRETIIRLGDEQSRTIEIPAKWIQMEMSLRTRIHLKLIPFEIALAIDEENVFPIGDPEQVKLFLRYHHSKGRIIYFDEEPLSEHIVLDPQYLIDAFKCIITTERFCTNDPDIRPLWKILHKEGRLEEDLIDKQWGKDVEKMFTQHKEILISFLIKHHIISEATRYDDATQQSLRLGWFVVPSLLKARLPQFQFQQFLKDKKQTNVRFVMLFDNSTIVPTIYHRTMAALIGKWPVAQFGTTVLISKDKCVVRLNIDHAGIAEMGPDTIELTVVSLCPSSIVQTRQADIFRRFSEAVINCEFSKLERKCHNHTKPYKTRYRCNDEGHNGSGSINTIDIDKQNDITQIPCPDLFSHVIDIWKVRLEWFQDRTEKIVISKTELNEKILSKISRCIGHNWQILGLELGVGQVQIEQISEDHPHSTAMKIYYMLKSWCCQMAGSANMIVLVQKMQKCPNVSIEWDAIRNIVDDIK
ncbi:uncharacterized protein LOC123533695 [Mercenaria mercenaria]|uniref:uncharacterized protein LOC123533695 n=1 Tax=Mercenaria mercenaria TaxID=6596 RepID=UPI00234E9C30|nr:uncharacterized protein LOC123533695 [Mercenaria mercenaria]